LFGRSDSRSAGAVVASRVDRSRSRGRRRRSSAVRLARGNSDSARGSSNLSAGGNGADSSSGVGGQLLGLVASGVRSRSDNDGGRSAADILLKGKVRLMVGRSAAFGNLAGDILAVKVTADAGVVAWAALAVGDGLEDVDLNRLRKLLDGTDDVLLARLGGGGGAVRSSDIGCQSQGRSDPRSGGGMHL
jgi:hypothetical protein